MGGVVRVANQVAREGVAARFLKLEPARPRLSGNVELVHGVRVDFHQGLIPMVPRRCVQGSFSGSEVHSAENPWMIRQAQGRFSCDLYVHVLLTLSGRSSTLAPTIRSYVAILPLCPRGESSLIAPAPSGCHSRKFSDRQCEIRHSP
jgi:hypothetical protein